MSEGSDPQDSGIATAVCFWILQAKIDLEWKSLSQVKH